MKRCAMTVSIAAVVLGATGSLAMTAVPATAAPPVVNGPIVLPPFITTDPCTGDPDTIHVTITEHEIDNVSTVVVKTDRDGYSDDGYVLASGHAHSVDNAATFMFWDTDIWSNPSTGAKFKGHFVFRFDKRTGTSTTDGSSVCIKS